MEGNNLHFHQHGASLVAQLVKNLPAIGRPGSIPGLGKSHGEGNGNLLQYSDLENSMDCIVHGVTSLLAKAIYFVLLSGISMLIQEIIVSTFGF